MGDATFCRCLQGCCVAKATVHKYDNNCYIVEKNRAPAHGGKKVIEALMGSGKIGCLLRLDSISLYLRRYFQKLKLWTKSEI